MMRAIKIVLILSLVCPLSFLAYAQGLAQEEAGQHYEKGKEYYEQAKYKEAEEEFQKALSLISQEENKLPSSEKEKTRQASKPSEYTIGEEDVLYISVWQDKDLSQETTVQPDGKISFPLAGEIPVLGLTVTQLKEELTKQLKEYIKNPIVSISLKKIGGRKVIILGEVPNSGVYRIGGATSVLEAIALAGGFTPNGVLSSVILIRGGFQQPQAMRLNLTRAISKAAPNQNIALQPADIIFVPKKFIANVNYFVSSVIGPIAQGIYTADAIRDIYN